MELLRAAGHREVADRLAYELIGRNVLPGRWTYQIVEEYDDTYYLAFRDEERLVRDQLTAGKRHVAEAEMKQNRTTPGHSHHT